MHLDTSIFYNKNQNFCNNQNHILKVITCRINLFFFNTILIYLSFLHKNVCQTQNLFETHTKIL